MIENSKGYKTFLVFDYFMVALLALICLLPMIHILAVSLSDRVANTAGMVTFWPVNFNLESYRYILKGLGLCPGLRYQRPAHCHRRRHSGFDDDHVRISAFQIL